MPDDRTVLEHLLQGRAALVRELDRLTSALHDLDAVIGQIGTAEAVSVSHLTGSGNVKPAGEGEARAANSGGAHKSIRVRVLEMLGAEDRDFGLAEIIERIHAAGIVAHDDAVRSITIKLMKDGKVERVGRGQYRLARASNASAAEQSAPRHANANGATPPPSLVPPWDGRD